MDAVDFTNQYLRIRNDDTGRPRGVALDDLMAELLEGLTSSYDGIIARYPRRFGKTTTLLGYATCSMLAKGNTLGYSTGVFVNSMRFLQSVAYSYKCLPKEMMISDFAEAPETFRVGMSTVEIPKTTSHWMHGREYDAMIYDDFQKRGAEFRDMVNTKGKTIIVGTFPLNSELGRVWNSPPRNWISLPTPEQKWKIGTILSLCNPMLTKGYSEEQ